MKNPEQNVNFSTVRESTEEENFLFREWCKNDGRPEERTCRPINKEGKKEASSSERKSLTFFVEGIEEPVGKFTYFDHNPRNRSFEFGYVLNPSQRGKKFGEKMLKACFDHLFSDPNLNLNKLYCQTAEFNIPSVKLLERMGLNKDAVLREHHELDGKFYADFVYSILRSEWEESKRNSE